MNIHNYFPEHCQHVIDHPFANGSMAVIVIKVGGSLYERPCFSDEVNAFVGLLPADETRIIIAGGGTVVDALRGWASRSPLSEPVCHDLAMHAMAVAGSMLATLIPNSTPVVDTDIRDDGRLNIIMNYHDSYTPSTWALTSDSIALTIAIRHQASRLILVKSCLPDYGNDWAQASHAGYVDAAFPELALQFTGIIETRSLV
jgi:5-(aminomethyl)-3-furanmethanol phosphate kinase